MRSGGFPARIREGEPPTPHGRRSVRCIVSLMGRRGTQNKKRRLKKKKREVEERGYYRQRGSRSTKSRIYLSGDGIFRKILIGDGRAKANTNRNVHLQKWGDEHALIP